MCTHQLGNMPCVNTAVHTGDGRGCIFHASWAPDHRHDDPGVDQ